MSLRTDPASGSAYGSIYESEPSVPRERQLAVDYFADKLGPQVRIRCSWGRRLAIGPRSGKGLIVPREEWDRMLLAAAEAHDRG